MEASRYRTVEPLTAHLERGSEWGEPVQRHHAGSYTGSRLPESQRRQYHGRVPGMWTGE